MQPRYVSSEEGLWVPEHGEYEGYDHALLLEFGSAASRASSKPVEWPVGLRGLAKMGMSVTHRYPRRAEYLSERIYLVSLG